MKSTIFRCIAAMTLFATMAEPPGVAAQAEKVERYTVINLGSLGGTSCCGVSAVGDVIINERGWVDGTSNLPGDGNFHPFFG